MAPLPAIYLRHLLVGPLTLVLLLWFRLIVRMHGAGIERAWWNPLVILFLAYDVAFNLTAACLIFRAPPSLRRITLSMRVQGLCDEDDHHGLFVAGIINGILPGHIRTEPKD